MTSVASLFDALWQDYIAITPSAPKVQRLLCGDEMPHNDHIALRTFNLAPLGLSSLAQHFEVLGYRAAGDYHFEQKKLRAKHYQHPNETYPKVFISELEVEHMPTAVQKILAAVVAQIPSNAINQSNFLYSGVHWARDFKTYETLLAVSEYAAWIYIWGFRANHFTISVNHLQNYIDLTTVNDRLKQAGIRLNDAGGEIKGSVEVGLQQSSTWADKVEVALDDQTHVIPSCFYEFALRHPLPNGTLYQGFVTASADKIFESTHVGQQQKKGT